MSYDRDNPASDVSGTPIWRVAQVPHSGLWHVVDAEDTEAAIKLPDGEFAWQVVDREAADRTATARNAEAGPLVDIYTGSDGSGERICTHCGGRIVVLRRGNTTAEDIIRCACCVPPAHGVGRRCWCLWDVNDGSPRRQQDDTCPVHASEDCGPTLDAVYAERNAVVLAFAYAADELGWKVGQAVDPSEPGWPVLMIDTPVGQVSWHFKAEDMPPKMPVYEGKWDGHTTPEKYDRLALLIRYGGRAA